MSAGLYTAEDWARFFEIFAEDGGNVTVNADQALKIAAFLRASVVVEDLGGGLSGYCDRGACCLSRGHAGWCKQ